MTNEPLDEQADQDAVLRAYDHCLAPFMEAGGYRTADVICVNPDTANLPELREKFLREHTHAEDEIRFFVAGQGYFWFNFDKPGEPVVCVKCEAGDLLSVPAGFKHWFDLGEPAFGRLAVEPVQDPCHRHGVETRVSHIAEVIAEAMGLDVDSL